MNDTATNVFEFILRCCAEAAPAPWYPRDQARALGLDLGALGEWLEELWLEGLIGKGPGSRETGPGFVLTERGARVLKDPVALEHLRTGRPLDEKDRGSVVRQTFRRPQRPIFTRLLLAANLAVFAYGLFLASAHAQTVQEFLRGVSTPPVLHVLHKSGAVSGADVIGGAGWRLLSAAFVHIGLLHILLNLYILYAAGSYVEQMWGHARYLTIYFLAAWAGSCLAVAAQPQALCAGASGALCGVLAAEVVWVILNGRFLPRALLRRWRVNMIVTVVMLLLMSLYREGNVSNWGHLGGAVAGGAAALLLNVQRFGPRAWRWLALVGLVPLPWLAWNALERSQARDPRWQMVERGEWNRRHAGPVKEALDAGKRFVEQRVRPLLNRHATRRDPQAVAEMLPEIATQRRLLDALADQLGRMPPARDEGVEKKRQSCREQALKLAEKLERAERELRADAVQAGQAARDRAREQADFEGRLLPRVDRVTRQAGACYRDKILPLLAGKPGEVRAVRTELDGVRGELTALEGTLDKAGPYRDDVTEEARQTAKRYVTASARLLDLARRRLEAPGGASPADEAVLRSQADEVERLRGAWRRLVE